MREVRILAIGKIKESYLQDGITEYSKRISGVLRLEVVELSEIPFTEKMSPSQLLQVKREEGQGLLAASKGGLRIALDPKGRELTSPGLANYLAQQAVAGQSRVEFFVGGSLGLSPEVLAAVDQKVSFSKLTFPHQLFRLILMEQIYRAIKIQRNEPYHR